MFCVLVPIWGPVEVEVEDIATDWDSEVDEDRIGTDGHRIEVGEGRAGADGGRIELDEDHASMPEDHARTSYARSVTSRTPFQAEVRLEQPGRQPLSLLHS